jgi:hypothetical protein
MLVVHGQSEYSIQQKVTLHHVVLHSGFTCYSSLYMVPIHLNLDFFSQHYTVIGITPLMQAKHALLCNIQNTSNFILQ